MSKKALGIDISDGLLTGVATEQRGKSWQVISCASLGLDDVGDISLRTGDLLELLGWQGGQCACGLPLSKLSLRNLQLPFKGEKKIGQVLQFELEDQLIETVDQQLTEFTVTGETDAGCQLAAMTLDKRFLKAVIAGLQEKGVDPEVITPGIVSVSGALLNAELRETNVLILHADLHSISLAVFSQGIGVFYRRLSYPERMVTHPPFSYYHGRPKIGNPKEADECIRQFCQTIEKSIDYFRLLNHSPLAIDRVLLTGPMAEVAGMEEKIGSFLGLQVELADLSSIAGVGIPEELVHQWLPCRYDRALALALQSTKKKVPFNFRSNEFAKAKSLTSSRSLTAIAAAVCFLVITGVGYLWLDYRSLKADDNLLQKEMRTLFVETFPDTTRVVDPYIQMQAALKDIESSEVVVPLYTQEKRVLHLLADISSRIPPDLTIHVTRLIIDQKGVQIKGTTDAYNNVDAIKNVLIKSPVYKGVQIVSATADKGRSLIRFEIQMELEGV